MEMEIMPLIVQAQLVFLIIGFLGGFVFSLYATFLLNRREHRFVRFLGLKSHEAQSDLELALMEWSKMGSRLSMACVVVIFALWLIKRF